MAKNATPMDVIRMALGREEEAVRLYTGFAGTVGDASVREMFLFLAEEEKRHARILQEEIEKETHQEM